MDFNSSKKCICPHCGTTIDKFEANCPKCDEENLEFALGKKGRNIVFLSEIKQLILFVFGWLGLKLISRLVSLIVFNSGVSDPILEDALINYISYGVLFIGFIAILWKDNLKILKSFAKGKSWLFGLLTFLVLITFNVTYNLILKSFISGNNANQEGVNNVTSQLPILSTLFFAIIGPICEEFTYRIGVFSLLRRRNRVLAYVVSSIIFGLIHFGWSTIGTNDFFIELASAPVYIGLGVILGLSYDLFGPASAIIGHVLNNTIGIMPQIFAKYFNFQ